MTKKRKQMLKSDLKRIRKAYETTNKSITYRQFKKRVSQQAKGTGESIGEAAKKEARRIDLYDYKDLARQNQLNAIKEANMSVYKEVKKKMGRFSKGEHMWNKIRWDASQGTNGEYVFSNNGHNYRIHWVNSPKDVVLLEY